MKIYALFPPVVLFIGGIAGLWKGIKIYLDPTANPVHAGISPVLGLIAVAISLLWGWPKLKIFWRYRESIRDPDRVTIRGRY